MKQFFNEKMFSDVEPYEIVEIINHKKVKVRKMKSTRIDKPIYDGMMIINNKHIRYDYESDDSGHEVIITKRKDDNWYQMGRKSGHYETKFINETLPRKYYDYSF